MTRRVVAVASLLLMAGAAAAAVIVGIQRFPSGISVLACVLPAAVAAWWGLTRRGAARVAGAIVATAFLLGAATLIVLERAVIANVLIVAAAVLSRCGAQSIRGGARRACSRRFAAASGVVL
jgi:hypothetical protein